MAFCAAELAECKFNEYPIDTWSKATLAVAPLFSATWAAAASHSASQDAFGGGIRPSSRITQVTFSFAPCCADAPAHIGTHALS